MASASYLFPNTNSPSRSIALTKYGSGVFVGEWDAPTTWYWTGTSYAGMSVTGVGTYGFSGAATDAGTGAWAAQWSGYLIHFGASGQAPLLSQTGGVLLSQTGGVLLSQQFSPGNPSLYQLPPGVITTGCVFVSSYNKPYVISASGQIYTTSGTSSITGVGAPFATSPTWGLAGSGTTLFTLMASGDQLGVFNLTSSGNSGTTGFISVPITNITCLTANSSVSSVAVGGWGYTAIATGFSTMFGDSKANLTVGLIPSINLINVYSNSPWGTLSLSQSINGFGAPTYGNWSQDGLHILITDPISGVISVYNSIFGAISHGVDLFYPGVGGGVFLSANNFVVCQSGLNTVLSFYASGATWVAGNTLSLSGASTVSMTTPFMAAVGYASGVAFTNITINTQSFKITSNTTLPFSPAAIASDSVGNTYAVGSKGPSGYLSIFTGQTINSNFSWVGSGSSVSVSQNQILVLDPSIPALRVFGYYAGSYQQISLITSLPSNVSGVYTSVNTPFSSGGVTFIYSSGATWSYQFVSPFGLVNIPNASVSVYHSGAWTTTVLGSGRIPSALTYDATGSLWVTTIQNDLYSVSATGAVLSHEVIPPYPGQLSNVPLGISSMLISGGASGGFIYGASSLNGALVALDQTLGYPWIHQ